MHTRNGDLPDVVTLDTETVTRPRFTPRELQLVKASLGRTFTQAMGDENTDDKFTILAWLKLRRSGFDVPFEAMQDVVIELAPDVADLDPTKDARPTISPPSAATGE